MSADMMLYWASGSPPCWRVMLTLEEKGLSGYKNTLISFQKKEQKNEDIKKLNHRCQVPTFKHGDVVINESLATCDYLESTFKRQGRQLLPDDPAELSVVLQRKYEVMNMGKQELLRYLFTTKKENMDDKVIAEKKKHLVGELQMFEGYLKETGAYAAGKTFTMTDVVLVPMLALHVRVGLKLEGKFPSLHAYYNRVCERQSVKDTWPPHWKDGPGSGLLADI